tara:strand:+ start:3021 stop:4019 length:999 start_codon:yes stop_codon:yes gene_type:complete
MSRIRFIAFSTFFLSLLTYYSCSVSGDPTPEAWVTFRVDMSNEAISTNGVHVAGTMVSTNGSIEEMVDADNDGIYQVTLSCTIGDTVEYMYLNSNVLGGNAESLDSLSCVLSETGNRWLEVPDTDSLILDIVCYNSCLACVDTLDGTVNNLDDLELFKGLWELQDICVGIDTVGFNINASGDTLWQTESTLDNDSLLIFFPDTGAYFTYGDWQGNCDNEQSSCFFSQTFDLNLNSEGQFTYYFLTEDNDSLFVYFTLALGVEELDHFTYDPNVLTIQYFIPPVYSFPSRTEVYDKINDDFDNIADIIPNFSPVCSNSGRLSLQHRLGLIDTP